MPRRQVDITIFPQFRGGLSPLWLRRAVLKALDVAAPGQPWQVSLVIADDDTVKRLNSQYRGLDEVTDVLSFSMLHQGHWEGEGQPPSADSQEPFIVYHEGPQPLGEVIISYPQTVRQAEAQGHPVQQELGLLIVHGVLHLLGYDHVEPDQETQMKQKEQQALSLLFGQ